MKIPVGKTHEERAEEYLHLLRVYPQQYNSFVVRLLQEVEAGGFTLNDIGTSEEELKKLMPI